MNSAKSEAVVFKKIEPPRSLKDAFVDELVGMILEGTLQTGSRLPSERALAEQMGVSRPIVSKGIADLVAKGFLEVRPRLGVYVADYRRNGTMLTLISVMGFRGETLNARDVESFLEVRKTLGAMSFRLFVEHLTERKAAVAQEFAGKVEVCTNVEDAVLASFDFHHEISVLGENSILPLIYSSFREPTLGVLRRIGARCGWAVFPESCRTYCERLIAKDLDGALARLDEDTARNIAVLCHGDAN